MLPRPVGRQREVLYLPANGHTVVLGTAGSGKTTLAILRALYLSDPSTDHDEGQDFSPEMLRSLAAAIPENGSLTFFGDIAQQIYGHRMSWRSAGLTATNIWRFEENYRNTKQISQLALALAAMPNFPDDPDLVEPTAPIADGPSPALVRLRSEPEEREFAVSRATELAQTGTVAILFRTRDQERTILRHLPSEATRLHRELDRWPSGPGLFYIGSYF